MRRFFYFLCFLLLGISTAKAGVEAEMRTILREGEQTHIIKGKFFTKGDKVRIDQSLVGVSQSTIIDYFSKKVWVLLHKEKVFVESTLDQVTWRQYILRGQIPSPQEAKRAGFDLKKLGVEKVEGFSCQVYEMKWKEKGKKVRVKMWVAKKLEGGIPLKTETRVEGGMQQKSTLHAVQDKELPDQLFTPPFDYARSEHSIVTFDPPS